MCGHGLLTHLGWAKLWNQNLCFMSVLASTIKTEIFFTSYEHLESCNSASKLQEKKIALFVSWSFVVCHSSRHLIHAELLIATIFKNEIWWKSWCLGDSSTNHRGEGSRLTHMRYRTQWETFEGENFRGFHTYISTVTTGLWQEATNCAWLVTYRVCFPVLFPCTRHTLSQWSCEQVERITWVTNKQHQDYAWCKNDIIRAKVKT